MKFTDKDIKKITKYVNDILSQYDKDDLIGMIMDTVDASGLYDMLVSALDIADISDKEILKALHDGTIFDLGYGDPDDYDDDWDDEDLD